MVSKPLPQVSTVVVPELAAVQRNQIDAPPARPAWSGSPTSFEAPRLEPVTVTDPEAGEITRASAKESFVTAAPAVAKDHVRLIARAGPLPPRVERFAV